MGTWSPQHFTAAVAQLTPGYEACEALLRGLATGGITLASGAALLPEVFDCAEAVDAGLAYSSLLPTSCEADQRPGPSSRMQHPAPPHLALRAWLKVLPWPLPWP